MSENTQTVVERAQREAERFYPRIPTRFPADNEQASVNMALRSAHRAGATFAATITPEQVEAAARAIQGIERNAGNVAGIEWCRRRVQATFTAAGFQIEADR